MIEGVKVITKKKIFDERGAIFHMLRRDDPEFLQFGEIYFSQVNPGKIKAWHLHKKMTLNYFLVSGSARLVLFDDRPQSKTRGHYQVLALCETDSQLIVIPPMIWNGFKCLGPTPALIANCASHPHEVDEIQRKAPSDLNFSYDWSSP